MSLLLAHLWPWEQADPASPGAATPLCIGVSGLAGAGLATTELGHTGARDLLGLCSLSCGTCPGAVNSCSLEPAYPQGVDQAGPWPQLLLTAFTERGARDVRLPSLHSRMECS